MDPNTTPTEEPLIEEPKAEGDTATPSETQETKPDEPKPRRNRRNYGERIAQLTAKTRQLERELEQARSPTKQEAAPKREDFADYEEYIDARAEYRAAQAVDKRLSDAEQKRRADEQAAAAERQQRSFEDAREAAIERGADAYPDFEDVTTREDLTITPVMADALLSSDKAHDIWYHLGKHPEVAEHIAGLSPVRQIAEIGKLEATLSGKRASSAPKPTPTVQPRGATNNALSDNLDTKEWIRRRNEEVRKSF